MSEEPAAAPLAQPAATPATQPAAEPRPVVERLGLAVIALVVAATFSTLGFVAITGGELFLGVMAGIGALMTAWAAAGTLRRG